MARQRKRAGNQFPAALNAVPGKKAAQDVRPFNPQNNRLWVHLSVLALLSLVLYLPTLGNSFVTDDKMQILQNPQVKDPQNWTQAFQGDVWAFAEGNKKDRIRGSNYYRPLQILTYEAEYAIFAERPAGWHFLNALVNAAVVCLVYLLAAELASSALAFWAGLFFALHPMHTETVAWIAAIPELQCALFLLLAMIFYHRARSGGAARLFVSLSTAFFFCALLSKETALLFPLILLAYEFLYRHKSLAEWRGWVPWLGPSLGVLAIYIAARIAALGGFSPHAESPRGILSPWELLVAIPPVFARYLGKLLLPMGMNYFYAFPLEKHLGVLVLGSMIVLAGFVLAALFLRAKWPLLAFAFVWVLLTLIPALSLNSIGENFFTERYLYIPSVGFCICAGWLAQELWHRCNNRTAQIAFAACLGILFAFYVVQIQRRIPVFHDDFTLLSFTAEQSPNAPVVQAGLASAYYEKGDEDAALQHGLRAIALNPDYEIAQINVAGYLSDQGRYDEAIQHLQAAMKLEPAYVVPVINLAKVYTLEGEWKRAAETYQRAAQLRPEHAQYFQGLAAVALAQERSRENLTGSPDPADKHPRDLATLIQLGDTGAQSGDWKRAATAFHSAVVLEPEDSALQYKLAVAQSQSGDSSAAIATYQVALKIQPDFPLARLGLAVALSRTGRYQDSLVELQGILKEQPQWEHADQVHMSLAADYEKLGDLPRAIEQYKQALELNPGLQGARQRLLALNSTR